MKIADALTGVTSLGIDTAPFIYLIEKHLAYLDRVRAIFAEVAQGKMSGISSIVTLTEVLTQPLKNNNMTLEQAYRRILLRSRHVKLLAIDAPTAERAARLRATYTLRTPDAFQIATALQAGCQAFLTNDRGLSRVMDLRILVLDDLEL